MIYYTRLDRTSAKTKNEDREKGSNRSTPRSSKSHRQTNNVEQTAQCGDSKVPQRLDRTGNSETGDGKISNRVLAQQENF